MQKLAADLLVKVSINTFKSKMNETLDENMTVEQFLELNFQNLLTDFKAHTKNLIGTLRQEYSEGVRSIKDLMNEQKKDNSFCVTLKCQAGPHIGQKFRLEPTEDGDDVFKMGRSSGKVFKERGVSLYKDKEISTTHATIEMRNGQVFLIDANSTNGTQLNRVDVVPHTPLRLKDGDIITMGSTDLVVRISDFAETAASQVE